MTFKQKVHHHYLQLANEKVQHLLKVLEDLKETGSNETKRTAGDKHETALAMLQIEQEQKRSQLKEAKLQQAAIENIHSSITTTSIVNGSLIKTNKGYFYMSAALGRANIDNISVIALSAQSPLGRQLSGLSIGGVAVFNNTRYQVEHIE